MREDEIIIYRTNNINGYRVDFDYFYRESRLHTNWANPVADIPNKMRFLKQFRCQGFSYAIADQLRTVLEEATPLFTQLREVEIQDLNVREDIYPVIRTIFDTLRGRIRGFRETASSKFMHMTYPNLLVMADSIIAHYMQHQNIIHHYVVVSEDYINLLRYYCNEINELINDIMNGHGVNRAEAINRLREKDPFAIGSIPRIIDKHFYWCATH
jgi:hypothetical protein